MSTNSDTETQRSSSTFLALASDEDTALIFPRNFAPLPRSRRPYGTLNPSVPM